MLSFKLDNQIFPAGERLKFYLINFILISVVGTRVESASFFRPKIINKLFDRLCWKSGEVTLNIICDICCNVYDEQFLT